MTLRTQPDWATGLVELLLQQRTVYQELDALSAEQGRLVELGDAEPLLNLLGQRQSLIDQLTQLNGRIEPYRQNWPALWTQLDASTQTRIQELIDEVQSLLTGIVGRDERDRLALTAQRDRVGEQSQHVRRGAAVHRAYGAAPTATEPRYTDRSS